MSKIAKDSNVRLSDGTAVYTMIAATLLNGLLLAPGHHSAAFAQVSLPSLPDTLSRPMDRGFDPVDTSRIERRLEEQVVEDRLEQKTEEMLEQAAIGSEEITRTVQDSSAALNSATSTVNKLAAGTAQAVRPFVSATDASGWAIEQNVALMLLDPQEVAAMQQSGAEVIAQREMPALNRTLVTVRDTGRIASRILDDLRQAHPGMASDFNHVYRFASQQTTALGEGQSFENRKTAGTEVFRVGMIDSAVNKDHFALQTSRIASQDFVVHEGERPLGHGTAVASLIARSAANEAEIYAASVFFQAPGYAPGASTESLVAALDWLASQQVDAINMSLAGPANVLLEEALRSMSETGPVIIAAVGNNGPSGEPLYPAAYEGVVGVTAVDREQKVFRYANRGEHVDYAALGVDVKVADSGGSWRLESGTSMASPHVAVVIARMLHHVKLPLTEMMTILSENAEDLGRKDFDPVFGYGLISDPPSPASYPVASGTAQSTAGAQ